MPHRVIRAMASVLIPVALAAALAMCGTALAQTAPADKPEILPEIDRLRVYARDLKAHRDVLEQAVADLRLYAQRLEKAIQDKDQEIQGLKAKSK